MYECCNYCRTLLVSRLQLSNRAPPLSVHTHRLHSQGGARSWHAAQLFRKVHVSSVTPGLALLPNLHSGHRRYCNWSLFIGDSKKKLHFSLAACSNYFLTFSFFSSLFHLRTSCLGCRHVTRPRTASVPSYGSRASVRRQTCQYWRSVGSSSHGYTCRSLWWD